MKIKEIEDARYEVLRLKEGLKYFKNEDRKAKQVSMINVFIRLINVSQQLLEQSVDKDIVDTMLLRMFEKEYDSLNDANPIGFFTTADANFMKDAIAFDVKIGSEGKKEMLALKLAGDMLNNS